MLEDMFLHGIVLYEIMHDDSSWNYEDFSEAYNICFSGGIWKKYKNFLHEKNKHLIYSSGVVALNSVAIFGISWGNSKLFSKHIFNREKMLSSDKNKVLELFHKQVILLR